MVHKNTLKKPNSQYTLTLSHPQDKKTLFFLLMWLLGYQELFLTATLNTIYIYIYIKVGRKGISYYKQDLVNKFPPWLELIKLHEQTPPLAPPQPLRAHKLQISTTVLHNTIPHPCNSSSCPQARRPIKAAHSFNFSIVTPLVNMSAGFLDPQIFSSITSLSSTR